MRAHPRQVAPFLDLPAERDGLQGPIYVDNLDWTAPLSAIDFLRDIGKHFRVSRMLAKEAVSARLNSEAGISYTEFSYQILQANDFLELYRRHGVHAADRRLRPVGQPHRRRRPDPAHRGREVHALPTPLVTKSDGTKIGKTEGGTVWLDPDADSPYAFFQYWLNVDDVDARAWLPLFSERPADEIEALDRREHGAPGGPGGAAGARRGAHRCSCTAPSELRQAEAAGRALFGRDDLGDPRGGHPGRRAQEAGSVTVDGELPTVAAAAAADRPRQQPVGGPPHGEGGRRLPEQRAGHRRRRRARRTTPGCPAAGWCCAGASGRSPGVQRPAAAAPDRALARVRDVSTGVTAAVSGVTRRPV